jgi:glycosyltransferase involved in cell wall biosynthesis
MKIALLVPNFAKMDGSARTAELQAAEWTKQGHYVAVFTFNTDIEPKGYDIFVMGMPKSLFWQRVYRLFFPLDIFKAIKWLPKLKKFDETVVHLYPLTWLATLAKKFYKVKYTFWYHGIPGPQFFPHFYEKVYDTMDIMFTKYTVQNVDRAVSVGKYGRKELKRYTGVDSEVIYNEIDVNRFHFGIDRSRIRNKYNLGDDPVILSVGAIRPLKGAHMLMRVTKEIRKTIPNIRLIIVGRHDYGYYSKQLYDSLDDNIVITGFVPDEELPFYYAAADIYASCSSWEIHNRPVLEAQACGKPLVAFDIEPFQEEVDENGILVPMGNIKEFAKACISKINQVNQAKAE